ncbi:hypothetical protein NLU13_8372 [Sarocladium strictum]|uniref:GATA-type domain-containing protein n=1 Tax=Sarocladium strictum TaxID=5046 RepID=A0AA39GC72_SARSR|nr:hypothetical protein NLU13_8372 [Sarocladium strictum]
MYHRQLGGELDHRSIREGDGRSWLSPPACRSEEVGPGVFSTGFKGLQGSCSRAWRHFILQHCFAQPNQLAFPRGEGGAESENNEDEESGMAAEGYLNRRIPPSFLVLRSPPEQGRCPRSHCTQKSPRSSGPLSTVGIDHHLIFYTSPFHRCEISSNQMKNNPKQATSPSLLTQCQSPHCGTTADSTPSGCIRRSVPYSVPRGRSSTNSQHTGFQMLQRYGPSGFLIEVIEDPSWGELETGLRASASASTGTQHLRSSLERSKQPIHSVTRRCWHRSPSSKLERDRHGPSVPRYQNQGERQVNTRTHSCFECGVRETPRWRRDQLTLALLCNVCGLIRRKKQEKIERRFSF